MMSNWVAGRSQREGKRREFAEQLCPVRGWREGTNLSCSKASKPSQELTKSLGAIIRTRRSQHLILEFI